MLWKIIYNNGEWKIHPSTSSGTTKATQAPLTNRDTSPPPPKINTENIITLRQALGKFFWRPDPNSPQRAWFKIAKRLLYKLYISYTGIRDSEFGVRDSGFGIRGSVK